MAIRPNWGEPAREFKNISSEGGVAHPLIWLLATHIDSFYDFLLENWTSSIMWKYFGILQENVGKSNFHSFFSDSMVWNSVINLWISQSWQAKFYRMERALKNKHFFSVFLSKTSWNALLKLRYLILIIGNVWLCEGDIEKGGSYSLIFASSIE